MSDETTRMIQRIDDALRPAHPDEARDFSKLMRAFGQMEADLAAHLKTIFQRNKEIAVLEQERNERILRHQREAQALERERDAAREKLKDALQTLANETVVARTAYRKEREAEEARDQARAELAEVKAKLDRIHRDWDVVLDERDADERALERAIAAYKVERDAALARCRTLETALRRFGRHKIMCDLREPCGCGFDAAQAALAGPEPATCSRCGELETALRAAEAALNETRWMAGPSVGSMTEWSRTPEGLNHGRVMRALEAIRAALAGSGAAPKEPAAPTPETTCRVPPPGWLCSRAGGHEGPCAASPAPTSEGEET